MKICMFTNTYLPHVGGVAKSVYTFQTDLERLGHQVLVIAPEYQGDDSANHRNNSSVIRLAALQNFNGSDFSLRIPLPFVVDQAIADFAPDIIHSHHPYLLGDTALRAARKRRLPLIFTHHTLYEQYTHYVTAESDLLQQFVIHLSTEYANLCDRVIAPSRSVAGLIKSRGVDSPVAEIPTGVDSAAYRQGNGMAYRQKLGIPSDALVIGHLGRLAPEKNIEYLSAAVSDCIAETDTTCFLCVGSGPAAGPLEEHFSQKGLLNRLYMPGNQTGQALVDAYHAMDLFVFSSHSETQGMVLTEAMAAGKPVIALDASGVREVVQDAVNGRLLPADASPIDFAAVVKEMARHPETISALSENALQTAQNFDRKNCARKLTELYTKAIQAAAHSKKPVTFDSTILDEIAQRIKAEWKLASNKVAALRNAVIEDI